MNGLPPPKLSREIYTRLTTKCLENLNLLKSPKREIIYHYDYLQKFCELLELDEFLSKQLINIKSMINCNFIVWKIIISRF